MFRYLFYIYFVWIPFLACSKQELKSAQTGIIEKTVGQFKLSIYLPPNYDSHFSHKVLYFNDGQTIFGSNGLNIDASADELIAQKHIEPLIIVGIHSDGNRTSNYVPYDDEETRQYFGSYTPNAITYTKNLIKDIILYIEKNYNTKPDRGIAGYSFGGLHSTWAALNHPKVFNFSGSLSPSYWVKNFELFNEGKKAQSHQSWYFDIGTAEWNYYVPMLKHLQQPILQNNFYYEDFGGDHQISDWRGQRCKNILLLFAGKTNLKKYTWDIKLEVIRSKSTGRFFLRLNPLIKYENGLLSSISYAADFTIINTTDGTIYKDGAFIFNGTKDLSVRIKYGDEEKIFQVRFEEVEKIKKQLGG